MGSEIDNSKVLFTSTSQKELSRGVIKLEGRDKERTNGKIKDTQTHAHIHSKTQTTYNYTSMCGCVCLYRKREKEGHVNVLIGGGVLSVDVFIFWQWSHMVKREFKPPLF